MAKAATVYSVLHIHTEQDTYGGRTLGCHERAITEEPQGNKQAI